MLTIFTAPKPFHGLIDIIQRNAIGSWLQLGPEVEVMLIGDEEGLAKVADELDVRHYPDVARNEFATPLVNSIFQIARENARYPNLCFVNTDVMFLDDLLQSVKGFAERFERFLIVGQRWDLAIDELVHFENGWVEKIRSDIQDVGRHHPPAGSDYFIFPKSTFTEIPPLAIGRAGWDNWMIFEGRAKRIPVIDASNAITIIHQDHDYGHLPDGKPHYDLPESDQNVHLAGGKETVFTLHDASWVVRDGTLKRRNLGEAGLIRALETAIILGVGPGRTTRLLLSLLHPWESFQYYFHALKRRIRKSSHGNQ
jgi:hypothetical protein